MRLQFLFNLKKTYGSLNFGFNFFTSSSFPISKSIRKCNCQGVDYRIWNFQKNKEQYLFLNRGSLKVNLGTRFADEKIDCNTCYNCHVHDVTVHFRVIGVEFKGSSGWVPISFTLLLFKIFWSSWSYGIFSFHPTLYCTLRLC